MPGTYYVNGDGQNVLATGSGNQITVGLTGITQHTVQVGGASNALTQIANGTTGQVLTATTGGDPSWQAAGGGGGGWTLIQTQTASGTPATLDFTTGVTGYNTYAFVVSKIQPATTAVALNLQISSNGGSTWISSGYTTGCLTTAWNASTRTNTNTTTSFFETLVISSAGSFSTIAYITSSSSDYAYLYATGTGRNPTASVMEVVGQYPSNFLINGYRWLFSSGNITSGTISLYGIQ